MIFSNIERVFGQINRALILLLSLLVVFCWLAISYEVVARYFYDAPTRWVKELTEFTLPFIAFLGAAWLQTNNQHVTIDFYKSLPPRLVTAVELFCCAVGIAMALTLVWYGTKLWWSLYETGLKSPDSMLGVPRYAIMLAVPAGSLLLLVQFVLQFIRHAGSLAAPDHSASG